MKRVGIAELKSHLSEHLRAAEAGETIEVMDRTRPIAKVVPFDAEAGGLEVLPASRSFVSVRRVRLGLVKLATTSRMRSRPRSTSSPKVQKTNVQRSRFSGELRYELPVGLS